MVIRSDKNITHGGINHRNEFGIIEIFRNNMRLTNYLMHSNSCHRHCFKKNETKMINLLTPIIILRRFYVSSKQNTPTCILYS